MTATQCTAYNWCEINHAEPGAPDYAHEKHVTLTVGDCEENFLLEVERGLPRIECSLTVNEVWLEPGEPTNTLRNMAELLTRAADLYDGFVRDVTPGLRRHHRISEQLAEVEN